MIFESVRDVARERFGEVFIYLQMVSLQEPAGQIATPEVKVMRGLFFVLLYGAFEKTVNEAVQLTLTKILALNPRNCDVVHPFNVITMSKKWKAVKDSGYSKAFKQLTDFFSAIESQESYGFDETLFATFLQNIWAASIEEVLQAMGASGFIVSMAQRVVIDEVVESRNAVAHGREAASRIGERPRCADLRSRFDTLQEFTSLFIDHLEAFILTRSFIQTDARPAYPLA
jgi:hypothetical protein